jgi:hypothetical protein
MSQWWILRVAVFCGSIEYWTTSGLPSVAVPPLDIPVNR